MRIWRKKLVAAGCALVVIGAIRTGAAGSEGDGRKEIEAFNKRYVELHLKMDTAGVLALWAEDGVDLMPGEAPMIGKKTIAAWVEDIVSKMPG